MHQSAMHHCQLFWQAYSPHFRQKAQTHVVEIGSQNVNGSLREVTPATFKYTGVDFVAAPGVDVILDDPYHLPFADGSVDVVMSSSCFEHAELFWLSFLEVLRVLKPDGLFYLNAPSNGPFHRYPIDAWRFYPDAGRALVKWAKYNRMAPAELESFTGLQSDEMHWNDYIAVFVKDESMANVHPHRIQDLTDRFNNGLRLGSSAFARHSLLTEDQRQRDQVGFTLHHPVVKT